LKDRNIVFKLKYYGDDIENSRHTADEFFPTEKTISIVIKTDYRELITSGIVERNEPDIFSKNSGFQISILCPDPFWYSMSPVVIPFGGIEPKFEFPFPNEEILLTVTDGIHLNSVILGFLKKRLSTIQEKLKLVLQSKLMLSDLLEI
jgi:hypothetical protein